MPTNVPNPFQILALSGGGFRGLYTAKVIADVEREINAPFASRFVVREHSAGVPYVAEADVRRVLRERPLTV
jgi:predicted patatin/cPLA2 family phospholipase